MVGDRYIHTVRRFQNTYVAYGINEDGEPFETEGVGPRAKDIFLSRLDDFGEGVSPGARAHRIDRDAVYVPLLDIEMEGEP